MTTSTSRRSCARGVAHRLRTVTDRPVDPKAVLERTTGLRDRIRAAGADPDALTICAVTKGFGPDAVRAAVAAGLVDIGENYAQEMLSKISACSANGAASDDRSLRWHMIGSLQRNKVRKLAPHVWLWQAVDRIEIAREISRWAPGAKVLVQVDHTGESTKSGADPAEVPALVEAMHSLDLEVLGLMTIGPADPSVDPRPAFEATAALADRLGLAERSMGMSRDLELAVASGATIVRVGTALFGPRPGVSL